MKQSNKNNTESSPNAIFTSSKWAAFSVILLFFGLVWIFMGRIDQNITSGDKGSAPFNGFEAPDFLLQTENGEAISTLDYREKPLIINLWTSWCPPCRAEMPALEQVYQEYNGEGLEILAVNITKQDNKQNAIQFARDLGISFPVLFDESGHVSEMYHLQALPTTFFIDKFGVIRDIVVGGPMSDTLLRTRVEDILSSQGNR
jgi:thiol-disulfide isomerase/thioredoxin